MHAPPVAGALLDARYRVGSVVARGGMSTVYRGVDTRLDRPVAIKIMDPRLAADPAFRTRFEREARAAARIDHPAVVDVYDQGEEASGGEGPVVFLVMELVQGATLRDVLRARGALGVPAAIAVMKPVLGGLAEAHRLGLVHRDVKPENVLISTARDVRVADFGLVTAAEQAGFSHAGMIMGTVAYLSPEQVATGAADARSDVYAAGVMLYELLTGVPPYQGETAISVAYRHVNTDMPAPSLIAGDVPPELDAVVLHATRRDPAGRPADAGAMLAELRDVARRLDVPRVPAPAPPVEDQHTEPSMAKDGEGPRGTRALPRPADDGPPAHVDARRRSRRIFAVWIAIVLVLALLVGVSAWWLGSGRWTEVPRIAGAERAAAERLLTEADLVPNVKVAYDNDVPAGRVAVTDPLADAELLRGSSVAVTVSNGRPIVPEIAPGTPVEAAEAAIRAVTLTPERSGSRSDQRTGTVAHTEPDAGTALPIGGTVTLVLGDADEESDQVLVPSLVGQSFESAAEKLSDLGLDVEQSRGLLGRRNGIVIGQSPSPGELVDKGSTVTLHTF